ncbi:hypothetical protein MLD38_033139 [Melastoma candidum]|uniref:Uncharacterized protein n=1 Tax=Melastoma candidum TaxID=119954 RepID=A0ACB9M8E8_9MYRT|nr:hypothetical protein MLD38_033139 [Melastoma candidum]
MKWHRLPILLRSPSSNRREPLLEPRPSPSEVAARSAGYPVPRTRMHRGKITRAHVAEAVGSTTAECAAVCCCFPCGIVNLVVLVVYRVPVSLCRKVWRRRGRRRKRRQQIKEGMGMAPPPKGRRQSSCRREEGKETDMWKEEVVVVGRKKDESAERLEKEMWERFYNAGFWRSPSQREQPQQKIADHQNQAQQQPQPL